MFAYHFRKHQNLWRAVGLAAVVSLTSAGCQNFSSSAANIEGVQHFQQGNYQLAADRFQKAIATNPGSASGYYNLASSLHKTGTLYKRPNDLVQAEQLYNQCLERDPNHAECHRGLAVLLSETNRQQQAASLLHNWSAKNPEAADPKIEVARLCEEYGQVDQAKTHLVQALAGDPHNARALTALGRLRDHEGDHAQALTNYQRSLELNRFQPQVASRVATLHAASGTPHVAGPAQSGLRSPGIHLRRRAASPGTGSCVRLGLCRMAYSNG